MIGSDVGIDRRRSGHFTLGDIYLRVAYPSSTFTQLLTFQESGTTRVLKIYLQIHPLNFLESRISECRYRDVSDL